MHYNHACVWANLPLQAVSDRSRDEYIEPFHTACLPPPPPLSRTELNCSTIKRTRGGHT
jgi:hypothetical protein